MTKSKYTLSDYSIVKSYKQLVKYAVSFVEVGGLIIIIGSLMAVGLKNVSGVDVELVGFSLLLLLIKSVITATGLYSLLKTWFGVNHYVIEPLLRRLSCGVSRTQPKWQVSLCVSHETR